MLKLPVLSILLPPIGVNASLSRKRDLLKKTSIKLTPLHVWARYKLSPGPSTASVLAIETMLSLELKPCANVLTAGISLPVLAVEPAGGLGKEASESLFK